MSVFKYKAKTKTGKIKKGVLVSASKKEVGAQLKSDGLFPLFVKEVRSQKKLALFSSRKISLIEKANLCRYLGTMIKSGLPLLEAVDVISAETTKPAMQGVLNDSRASLQEGQALSVAFSKYPEIFDEIFLTLVKVGEESGSLDKSFEYLSKQLRADYELRQKIKSTLAYPTVIILATFGLGMSMLVFVVPRIAPVLLRLSRDFKLPTHTVLILKVGLFLSDHLVVFVVSFLGLLAGLVFLGQTRFGKGFLAAGFSRLPVISRLYLSVALARFNRTLSTLLGSGVPIISALQISSQTLNLPKYQKTKELFSKELAKGVSLAKILKESNLFPPMMTRMVATGEKTGVLDELLLDLAGFYEEEVANLLKTVTSIIEPILMLVIGIGVGLVVVSVIAPIYSFVGSLSQSIGGG